MESSKQIIREQMGRKHKNLTCNAKKNVVGAILGTRTVLRSVLQRLPGIWPTRRSEHLCSVGGLESMDFYRSPAMM